MGAGKDGDATWAKSDEGAPTVIESDQCDRAPDHYAGGQRLDTVGQLAPVTYLTVGTTGPWPEVDRAPPASRDLHSGDVITCSTVNLPTS